MSQMMHYIKLAPSGTSRIRSYLCSHLVKSTGNKRCLDLCRRRISSSQSNNIILLHFAESSCRSSINLPIQRRCNNTLAGKIDLKSSVSRPTSTKKEITIVANSNINIRQDFDFFGEPITFFLKEESIHNHHQENEKSIKKPFICEEALLSYDAFIIQYITKGKSSDDGGDEFGISAKAAHSTAIPWSELLTHLLKACYQDKTSNENISYDWKCEAPMLACAAISPILALGGSSYLKLLDECYAKSMSPSFTIMAQAAISILENQNQLDTLSDRERYHLHALKYLLEDNHNMALSSLRKLLELCPGDALALSLTIDIASVIGDKQNAFYAATSIASYWNERGQRSATGQTAIPGYAIGSSLIALGLAVGGRFREAEQLVDIALKRDTGGSSGICAWAFAHIYDSEGRVSEGTSLYTGYGKEYYETCGFMFFDAIMAGIGGRFILDRDGATADNVAKRLYDENFGRIFEYSGYDNRDHQGPVFRSAPGSRRKLLVDSAAGAASSVFNQFFGQKTEATGIQEDNNNSSSTARDQSKSRTLEDVFAWLPPTPHLLTEATLFLVRLTISGTIGPNDERWSNLCVAWEKAIEVEKNYGSNNELFRHFPLARVTASLILGDKSLGGQYSQTEIAISILGSLMKLNSVHINVEREQWKFVAKTLSDIRSGTGEEKYFGWDQNFGNFLEHAICHAAIESDDHEMFCLARSVCSESIALRANSPETWFRYGVILQKLGDEENAENAFQASISLGSGEGGKMSPT
jgi:tetratricopeptide (TPR) repeat protein